MARGPVFDVPMSRLATWSGRLAWFAVAVFSIIIVRSGLLEIVPALATFAAALIFAGLAILLAFGGFVMILRHALIQLRTRSGLLSATTNGARACRCDNGMECIRIA